MKSLLYQPGATPFSEPVECSAIPCRSEVELTIVKNGIAYKYVLRDKVVPEDPYLIMVKAAAESVRTGEGYNGATPDREVRDHLIKNNVSI